MGVGSKINTWLHYLKLFHLYMKIFCSNHCSKMVISAFLFLLLIIFVFWIFYCHRISFGEVENFQLFVLFFHCLDWSITDPTTAHFYGGDLLLPLCHYLSFCSMFFLSINISEHLLWKAIKRMYSNLLER